MFISIKHELLFLHTNKLIYAHVQAGAQRLPTGFVNDVIAGASKRCRKDSDQARLFSWSLSIHVLSLLLLEFNVSFCQNGRSFGSPSF